jgi:hypothetical protein
MTTRRPDARRRSLAGHRLFLGCLVIGFLTVPALAAHAQTSPADCPTYPSSPTCVSGATVSQNTDTTTNSGSNVAGTTVSNDGGTLAFTGANILRLLAVALVLLATGTALVYANRRRRSEK